MVLLSAVENNVMSSWRPPHTVLTVDYIQQHHLPSFRQHKQRSLEA